MKNFTQEQKEDLLVLTLKKSKTINDGNIIVFLNESEDKLSTIKYQSEDGKNEIKDTF